MPPKKRKASESVERDESAPSTRKLTKKEQREQAMARARAAMQQDKQRVAAVKAKKKNQGSNDDAPETPAVKRRKVAAERKTTTSKKKAREEAIKRAKEWGAQEKEELKKKKALSPEKNTPVKSDEDEDESEDEASTPVQSSSADMAAGSGRKSSSSKKAQPAAASPVPPTVVPQPTTLPPNAMAGGAPMTYNGPMNPAIMAQYMMSQQGIVPPQGYGNPYMMQQQQQQQPYGGGSGAQFPPGYTTSYPVNQQKSAETSPVPPQSQSKGTATKPPFQNQTGTGVRSSFPPLAASPLAPPTPAEDDDDDDDDAIPPPPVSKLEMQISQQVLANVAAATKNQPTPFNAPPPEAYQHDCQDNDEGEEEEIDEEPIFVDDEDAQPMQDFPQYTEKKSSGSRSGLFGAIIIAIISYFIMTSNESSDSVDSPSNLKPQTFHLAGEAPCFIDTVSVYDEVGEIVVSCENGVPCPSGGICEGGELIECNSKYYEVSENKAGCVLSTKTNTTLGILKDLVSEYSKNDQCGFSFDARPMYSYSKLQLEKPRELATNPLPLAVLETIFVSELRNDGLYIGLLGDLDLPFKCLVGWFIKSSLQKLVSLLLSLLYSLLGLMWSCFTASPLGCTIGIIVLLIVKRGRDYGAYRSKLVRDIAHVRQLAYEILQENSSESHVVLHIRDEIAMSLYPDSKYQRQYLIKDVWPRVIPDFVTDNRIRKASKVIEGKPRDVWQWVAAASAKKRPVIQ